MLTIIMFLGLSYLILEFYCNHNDDNLIDDNHNNSRFSWIETENGLIVSMINTCTNTG